MPIFLIIDVLRDYQAYNPILETGGLYLHGRIDWSPVGVNKSKPKSWAGLQFISSHRRPAAGGSHPQSTVCLHRWKEIEMVTCRSNEVEAPFGASTSLLPQATSRGALAAINRWEEIEMATCWSNEVESPAVAVVAVSRKDSLPPDEPAILEIKPSSYFASDNL